MSDTTIALLILPFLVVLTICLECTRVGCTKLFRHLRRRSKDDVPQGARHTVAAKRKLRGRLPV